MQYTKNSAYFDFFYYTKLNNINKITHVISGNIN